MLVLKLDQLINDGKNGLAAPVYDALSSDFQDIHIRVHTKIVTGFGLFEKLFTDQGLTHHRSINMKSSFFIFFFDQFTHSSPFGCNINFKFSIVRV